MTTTSAPAVQHVETVNPATGEPLERYPVHGADAASAALDRAVQAFRAWRDIGFERRAAALSGTARTLRADQRALATLVSQEMGKPLTEAEAEIEKCAFACDHFAQHAATMLANEDAPSTATRSYAAFRPLGVVLAIMPWNFPFWQVFRFVAPGLMAGNAGVLKHAANVTGCALAIERVLREGGVPDGVFTTLVVASKNMEAIVADPRVAAVTLTGSDAAGSSVAAVAGKHLKKTVLELGGSDAFIVLADADIAAAAKTGVRARFQNTGQSCIAAKRFIIERSVYGAFVEAFVEEVKALRVGDPLDPGTQVGPLARADLREALERQVESTLEAGATLEYGGRSLDGAGFFYAPTVVGHVQPGTAMFDEETFGPAAAMVEARDAEHAIELANASPYGLGGNIWTRDVERAERLAAHYETGGVFINGMTASDPRLPFGGVKHSGYGRELSHYGIKEFVNVQTVWIGPARDASSAPKAPAE